MLDILLNFLGINSWYYNFLPIKKNKLNTEVKSYNRNLKTINILHLLKSDTPSPKTSIYIFKNTKYPSIRQYTFFTFYTLYYTSVLCLLFCQPVYTLVKFIKTPGDLKLLSSFLLHLNLPLISIWCKWYFKTNHLELILKCKKHKIKLIMLSTLLSIIINLIDINSFHNDYYWVSNFNNDIVFFTLIHIEWIYSRMYMFTFMYSFIYVINMHILKLNKIIRDIENNEFDFENNVCLSNIIKEIARLRHEIEITISFYNNIISVTTVLGGLALAIFIKDNFNNNFSIIEIDNHDRYLIGPLVLYIISQIVLITTMLRYSVVRDSLLKYIKSVNFINRFLSRVSTEKIMKKTNDINLVVLNILEETATTIDWVVLGNILSEKWLDFTIFGISTSDGKLIKKSITLGGTLLFLISFLQNNN